MFEGRNVHFSQDNKPLCSFSAKVCKLRRLNGYAFCVRHILEDKTAPFKQCAFVVKSSQLKCTSAIPVAEQRMYCNAHMQVLGMIPKKERKPKVRADSITQGLPYLERLDHHDDVKPQPGFSASKMFPELAGKLSLDYHNGEALPRTEKDTTPENGRLIKSPVRSSSLPTPKRQKKQTRKYLSIQRKKLLGMLTDDEARTSMSTLGYQTYAQFAARQMYNANIVTPIIDSSDDEECSFDLILTRHPRLPTKLTPPSDSNDSDVDAELVSLKQQVLSLTAATSLNRELCRHRARLTDGILKTLQDNSKCSVFLLNQIHNIKRKVDSEGMNADSKHTTPRSKKLCLHTRQGDGQRCQNWTLPFANYCTKHIMYSVDQKLFDYCTYTDSDTNTQCCRPIVDNFRDLPLCAEHGHYELGQTVEPEPSHRYKKRKPKPFALLRPSKKKKKKHGRAAVVPLPATISDGSFSAYEFTDEQPEEGKAAQPPATAVTTPEDELDENSVGSIADELLSPLDKSLELQLDQAESKLLEDSELDQVLNILSDKNMDLMDGDASLIMDAVTDDDLLESELPDHITDTILHVESEQRSKALQLNSHRMHSAPHMLGNYELSSIESSFNETDFHALQQQEYNQGPPPEYPGATKIMSGQAHHGNACMPQPEQVYSHHPHLRQKLSPNDASHMMMRSPGGYGMPPHPAVSMSRMPLPPSSTLLETSHSMGRLPPVSSITMHQWQSSDAPYQNGYHHQPREQYAYSNNCMPSPPHYNHIRQQLYPQPMYNNQAFNMVYRQRVPAPQLVDVSLQHVP